jgi:hypothetical protein
MSNIWSRLINLAGNITGILGPANGGTGIANNAASTLTVSGAFATTLTVTNTTGVTLPTTGTLLANSRNINTTAPITGGGDLSADRTIAISAIAQSTSGVDASAAQRLGTNTNDLASAGNIGQVITQTRLVASALSITSNTATNVTATKLTLTAGDWEIWGVIGLTGTATAGDIISAGISPANSSATLPGSDSNSLTQMAFLTGNMDLNILDMIVPTPRLIVNLTGNTDYYLVVRFRFATGTASTFGQIQGRRMR